MTDKKRKILVTNGLTYANDLIHLGHAVGYIQADIWTRFQKMHGNECYYVCGSDCHGTPVMLRAQELGQDPESLVAHIRDEQARDIEGLLVELDNYYTTHSPENRELSEMIYKRLEARGDIVKHVIEQFYDEEKKMFLPDRFVRGECPRCGALDQYGDSCEVCSATYSPTELKNPRSALTGTTPVTRESEHFFFNLPAYEERLKAWMSEGHVQEQVAHKMDEWFEQGLKEWDISRDAPYFGFEIPGKPGKYFYVWMDAPIGYIASFKHFCDQVGVDYSAYWDKKTDHELYHFIGKDIVYFHALFWPAMLMGAELKTPTALFTHGFLTINGQKMSKSRGTFIRVRKYLEHLKPEYLRYYLAAKMSSRIEDVDLNLEDFRLRVNADLVGKVVNIASRCAGFVTKRFEGKLSDQFDESLLKTFSDAGDEIAALYENRDFSHAVRRIMELADLVNQYIDEKKPWVLAKEEGREDEVQTVCSVALNAFRLLMLYLKPILPEMAQASEGFLNIKPLVWVDRLTLLKGHTIDKFKPLMQRVEPEQIESLSK